MWTRRVCKRSTFLWIVGMVSGILWFIALWACWPRSSCPVSSITLQGIHNREGTIFGFSPDGLRLATSRGGLPISGTSAVRIWDITSEQMTSKLSYTARAAWDARSTPEAVALVTNCGLRLPLSLSPDGRILATTNEDETT